MADEVPDPREVSYVTVFHLDRTEVTCAFHYFANVEMAYQAQISFVALQRIDLCVNLLSAVRTERLLENGRVYAVPYLPDEMIFQALKQHEEWKLHEMVIQVRAVHVADYFTAAQHEAVRTISEDRDKLKDACANAHDVLREDGLGFPPVSRKKRDELVALLNWDYVKLGVLLEDGGSFLNTRGAH